MDAGRFSVESLEGDVRVITVEGELDLSNARELDALIAGAARDGARGLLVDLTNAEHVDSTGLASLLNARQQLEGSGVRLVVGLASAHLQRTFEVRGVEGLFELAGSRDEGLRALRDGGP